MNKQDFIQAIKDGKTVIDTQKTRSIKLVEGKVSVTFNESLEEMFNFFNIDSLIIIG